MRHEIKFVGSGGQGIITAAIVLAEAAANCGLNATQTQAYGPEARGSLCSSETIISSGAILFPKSSIRNIRALLTQEACDIYLPLLAANDDPDGFVAFGYWGCQGYQPADFFGRGENLR
ncbi:MAG: 2-oxoacid:acceptor oxidoreductase family protein [Oscillospiraceae bacterium]